MLNQKYTALLLSGALILSLGASALAAADAPPREEDAVAQSAEAEPAAAAPESGAAEQPEPDGAEPQESQEPQEGDQTPEEPAPEETKPDAAGTLSFGNLAGRVKTGSLQYLILEESVAGIEANDYDKIMEDLRDGLNNIANMQWGLIAGGSQIPPIEIPGSPEASAGLNGAIQGMISMSNASAAQSLQAQYDALRDAYDDLKEGKTQKEAADGIRQLREAQNSIVMLTESMYVQLDALNDTDAALGRALESLDRQIQEMELRYELGQISALSLQQIKAGRTSLLSQRETLRSNASALNMSLESMVGTELTGRTRLSGLPKVGGQELAAMDLETDLTAAKEASFTLYDARKKLDDAKETYQDAGKKYNHNEKKYQYVQAKHSWQGAQYTYDSAVQSFELKFRALYAQVKDDQQVLEAARTALAVEKDNCAVKQLKYEQGTISKNALLTAQDEVANAQDKVDSAQRDLFSAYHNYRWAVDHGILN